MTAQGHPRAIFGRAIRNGNLVVAEMTARALGKISRASHRSRCDGGSGRVAAKAGTGQRRPRGATWDDIWRDLDMSHTHAHRLVRVGTRTAIARACFPGRSPSESPAATTTTERHPMPATTSTTRGPPGRFTARGVSATSPRSRRKRRSARTPRLPPATKRSAVIAAARRTPRAAPRTRPRSSLGHTMASARAPTDALRRSGMPPAGVEPARPV